MNDSHYIIELLSGAARDEMKPTLGEYPSDLQVMIWMTEQLAGLARLRREEGELLASFYLKVKEDREIGT